MAEPRTELLEADGMLIASPECAPGVSCPVKNALPRAIHTFAALRETITAMWVNLVEGACITVPLLGKNLDADGIAGDPVLSAAIDGMLKGFQVAIMRQESAG